MRIVIELKSGAFPQKVLNSLYKHTELETVFHYNMLALVDGVPKLLSLKGMLTEFLKHRRTIVTRRAKFDLRRAEERAHILEGLKKAVDIIDAIIKTIRASADAGAAHAGLVKKFDFTALQATAILEMKLQKLAGLEIKKVLDELGEKQKLIKELKALLADERQVLAVVRTEAEEIKKKYGQPRRTKIIAHGVKEISAEDLVPEKENVLVLTAGGYIKRTDPAEFRSQRRGGVGVVDLEIKEEDFVTLFLTANTHSDLLFFTNRGRVYQTKMYEIPEGKRATRGKSVMNFLPLGPEEIITSVLTVPKSVKSKTGGVLLVTRRGVTKKVALQSFADVRRSGIIAIKLDDNDALVSAQIVGAGDEVILGSRRGQAIRFRESDVRAMGRTAGGVRGIKLGRGDEVVGASVIRPEAKGNNFLVMTARGYGKMTRLKEYKTQKRGGSGIKTAQLNPKTGDLIDGKVIDGPETEIVAISKQGQVIRTRLAEIPTLGRQTQGVRIMRLRDGDALASLTLL